MFITNMSLPRRTFLQGVGATIALPFLEAMLPAFKASAAAEPVRRFGAVYVPHGKLMSNWTPLTPGADFDYPRILKPLEPFRSQVSIISGLSGPPIVANGGHAVAPSGYLSGHSPSRPKARTSSRRPPSIRSSRRRLGRARRCHRSKWPPRISALARRLRYRLQLRCMNTISWAGPTSPLPMEVNPRRVFERLFGKPGAGAPPAAAAGKPQHSRLGHGVDRPLAETSARATRPS
jgi:hypothetical protein